MKAQHPAEAAIRSLTLLRSWHERMPSSGGQRMLGQRACILHQAVCGTRLSRVGVGLQHLVKRATCQHLPGSPPP